MNNKENKDSPPITTTQRGSPLKCVLITSPKKVVNSIAAGLGKRRRTSFNAITGDFALDSIETPVFKQPTIPRQQQLDIQTPVVFAPKAKKSIVRRVSFAATAHVRTFDNNLKEWDDESPESNSKKSKKSTSLQSTPKKTIEQKSDRRSSDPFDHLQLSPVINDASDYENDVSMEYSGNSFDVTVAGSPHVASKKSAIIPSPKAQTPIAPMSILSKKSPRKVQSSVDSPILSKKSPRKAQSPHSKRRDSIAGFFDLVSASPEESQNASRISSLRSSPKRRSSLAFGNNTSTPYSTQNYDQSINEVSMRDETIELDLSSGKSSTKRSSRDSIAGFFDTQPESENESSVVFEKPTPIAKKSSKPRDSIAGFFDTSNVSIEMDNSILESPLSVQNQSSTGRSPKKTPRRDSIAGFFDTSNVSFEQSMSETPQKDKRRDSVAGFFDTSNTSVDMDQASQASTPRVPTSRMSMASEFEQSNMSIELGSQASSAKNTPRVSTRRDSVAGFFEQSEKSPVKSRSPTPKKSPSRSRSPTPKKSVTKSTNKTPTKVSKKTPTSAFKSSNSKKYISSPLRNEVHNGNWEEGNSVDLFGDVTGIETPEDASSDIDMSMISKQLFLNETADMSIAKSILVVPNNAEEENDTIGRFFFSGVETPKMLGTPNKLEIDTPNTFAVQESLPSDNSTSTSINQMSPHSKQVFAQKMATPIRPVIQQMSVSTKITSEVKRLDRMLKDALTPSRTPKSSLRFEIGNQSPSVQKPVENRRDSMASIYNNRRLSMPAPRLVEQSGNVSASPKVPLKEISAALQSMKQPDLMDEEMSIFDCSFNVDAEVAVEQILTLNEFMAATGFENIDIQIPVMTDGTMDVSTHDAPTFNDFVLATMTHIPEFQLYEFGCNELKRYIEEGKDHVTEMEAEMNSNPPLIFTEFAKGTAQERSDIILSLKKKKEYAQSLTQEAWYTWRENLMEPLSLSLIENVDRLKRDLKYATQITDDCQSEEAGLDAELEAIEQEMAELSAEVAQLQQSQDAELCAMNHDMVTKKSQLDDVETYIMTENVTLKSLEVINQSSRQSQYDLTLEILNVQIQLDKFTIADPFEVDQFIKNFELSEAINGWNITCVKVDQLILCYNDQVDFKFQKNNHGSWSSSALLKSTMLTTSIDQRVIQECLNKSLEGFAECLVSDWMNILQSAALFMTRCAALMLDLNHCTKYCYFEVDMDSDDSLCVSLQFSNIQKRLQFEVKYRLTNMTDYPYQDMGRVITFAGKGTDSQNTIDHLEVEIAFVKNDFVRFSTVCSRIGNFLEL